MDDDGETAGEGEGGVAGAERLLARRKEKEALALETPWQASLRKDRERKKARKKAFKEKMEALEAEGGEEQEEQEEVSACTFIFQRYCFGYNIRGVTVKLWGGGGRGQNGKRLALDVTQICFV